MAFYDITFDRKTDFTIYIYHCVFSAAIIIKAEFRVTVICFWLQFALTKTDMETFKLKKYLALYEAL